MISTRIPRSLRQRVVAASRNQCAYCHTLTSITGARLVVDHIIPQAAGGETVWENLCLACHSCNEFKGAQVEAQDPLTGESVPLFHPRRQQWRQHFHWSENGSEIVGLTPVGRATVAALNMNHPAIVEARRRWARVGWHPPQEDL
ncbi:MAG: HNH endonuclease [Chloroflexi bacterium]|nr:HNH endonuclease [Chloroflexota bacterium]